MESVNKIKTKEKPEIIAKKELPQNTETYSSFSQTTSPTNDQFQYQNQYLTEKSKKDKNPLDSNKQNIYTSPPQKNKITINEKNDSNGYINNIPSLSIKNNLNKKKQMKPTKIKLFSQFSSNLNPKNQNLRNSMIVNNYYKMNSKNSLPINRNRSTSHIYSDDKQKDSTFRYNNSGKYSPIFTYNSEDDEEMNYNSRFSEELSMQKFNSNISINNNKNNKNYENNDNLSKFNNKKKNNNNIIYGDPSLYSSDENMENSLKYEEDKKNLTLSKKNKKKNKKNDSYYDNNYNEIDNIFEAIREEMEKLIKMKVEIFVNKMGTYLSNKNKNLYRKFFNSLLSKKNDKNNKTKKILLKRIIKNKIKKENHSLLFPLLYWNKISKTPKEMGQKPKNELNNIGKNINQKKEKDINKKEDLDNNTLTNENNNDIDNIEKLNDNLLNIFISREKYEKSNKLFNLRKWNMITKKLSCISKIETIQKNVRKYLKNNKKNKFKTFLENICKDKIIYTLNDIARVKTLKSSLTNIGKKRVNTKIYEKLKQIKLIKLLNKIIQNINNKNNNAKMKYYLNKWNNRTNFIKNKDNKKLKFYLLRIVNRKDILKNLLKSYFLKWKKKYLLLKIIDSVIKIQKNWRRKKAINDYNKTKDKKKKITESIKIIEKAYKKRKFELFVNKLKDKNKKNLLLKIGTNFKNKRNSNLKYVMDKIKEYNKKKYVSKILNISEKAKNEIIKKYFILWKNKTSNNNKINKYLTKFIERKDYKNKSLILSALYKWLFHSKINDMEQKVIFIQKQFRDFKSNKDSKNNWKKLKNNLNINKTKKEIGEINKKIKLFKNLNLIKKYISMQSKLYIFKILKHHYNIILFRRKMIQILNQLTGNKASKSLKKYFIIWRDNINKEIEREDKLNDLLYVIEKRMNINCANYLSYVSLIKNIFDGVLNIRKIDSFYILKEYAEKNKNINNLSYSLSLAYNDLKLKKYKNFFSKILKYFVYLKFLKLFDILKGKKEKDLKTYKALLISYLKNKSDAEVLPNKNFQKRNSQTVKTLFKPKTGGNKQLNKSQNKSLGVIKTNKAKIEPKKTLKEKGKEKGIIKSKDKMKNLKRNNTLQLPINKNIMKKEKNEDKQKDKQKDKDKNNDKNKDIGRDKSKEDNKNIIIVKSDGETESENENDNNKENINNLLFTIENIFTINKRELLLEFKERALKEKTKKEKEEEKILYMKKFKKILKKLALKKLLMPKDEISIARKLLKLVKLTAINIQLSKDRWIRQLLRKWRFISFSKNLSKRKLELMYQNLHLGYLEIINALFNNQSQSPSIMKEFENFGDDIGMFENPDNYMKREKELYQKVKKKYNTKPIDQDKENLANIESTKFNNFLKFKSIGSGGEDSDFLFMDSDREILSKQKGGLVSKNYDLDK